MNIPLYRAETVSSREVVIGYYVFVAKHSDEWGTYPDLHMIIEKHPNQTNYKIDPSTLKISFDNGENFDSIEDVEYIISMDKMNNS